MLNISIFNCDNNIEDTFISGRNFARDARSDFDKRDELFVPNANSLC